MSSIYDWSTTAANNATSDASINWQEGQLPSTVNNSARVMMERVKEFILDIGSANTVGGSANSISLTAISPMSAYSDGMRLSFRATTANTGAATINVNSVGAKSIRKITSSGEVSVAAGDIWPGQPYDIVYFGALNGAAGGWLLINPNAQPNLGWKPVGLFEITTPTTTPFVIALGAGKALRLDGRIKMNNTTDSALLRISVDGGNSYYSGASDYTQGNDFVNAGSFSASAQASTSSFTLANANADPLVGTEFKAKIEGGGGLLPSFRSDNSYVGGSRSTYGWSAVTNADVTHVQIRPSASASFAVGTRFIAEAF